MLGRCMRTGIVLGVLGVAGAVATGSATAGGSGTQVTHFKVAYWESASGAYWTCSGVHQVRKTGAVTESETCTTASGPFVAGTYASNGVAFPTAFPGGCGAYFPGLPGVNAPDGYTAWQSDDPGFTACARSFALTLAPIADGGWTETVDASY